jgi:hypothetical protein
MKISENEKKDYVVIDGVLEKRSFMTFLKYCNSKITKSFVWKKFNNWTGWSFIAICSTLFILRNKHMKKKLFHYFDLKESPSLPLYRFYFLLVSESDSDLAMRIIGVFVFYLIVILNKEIK